MTAMSDYVLDVSVSINIASCSVSINIASLSLNTVIGLRSTSYTLLVVAY